MIVPATDVILSMCMLMKIVWGSVPWWQELFPLPLIGGTAMIPLEENCTMKRDTTNGIFNNKDATCSLKTCGTA